MNMPLLNIYVLPCVVTLAMACNSVELNCPCGNTYDALIGFSNNIETVSTCTGIDDGDTCDIAGTDSYVDMSDLWYSDSTGKFTGYITGNQCPPTGNGVYKTAECQKFQFPQCGSSWWESPPYAMPKADIVAMTFELNYIFGAMDTGFGTISASEGQYCSLLDADTTEACSEAGVACCPPGTSAAACEDLTRYECETLGGYTLTTNMFLDYCGAHDMDNYHFHIATRCQYNQYAPTEHSPVVAIAADGYGIYGLWENSTSMPSLDACNGHTDYVPSNTFFSSNLSSTSVYHYHFTPYPPFTLGCYGPVDSMTDCNALYTFCSTDRTVVTFTLMALGGTSPYNSTVALWCPCIQHYNATAADYYDAFVLHYISTNAQITTVIDSDGYNIDANAPVVVNGYYTTGGSTTTTTSGPTTTSGTTGTTGTTATTTSGPSTASTATTATAVASADISGAAAVSLSFAAALSSTLLVF